MKHLTHVSRRRRLGSPAFDAERFRGTFKMSAIDWTAVILAAGGIYIALFFAARWVFQMGYHHE